MLELADYEWHPFSKSTPLRRAVAAPEPPMEQHAAPANGSPSKVTSNSATVLRRQILAILPEIELFIIAFDCGLNPRSRRTKPALITWLLPHWREAEPHVFAFLDRAKHDSIREAWLGEGVDLPPVHPAETPEERRGCCAN